MSQAPTTIQRLWKLAVRLVSLLLAAALAVIYTVFGLDPFNIFTATASPTPLVEQLTAVPLYLTPGGPTLTPSFTINAGTTVTPFITEGFTEAEVAEATAAAGGVYIPTAAGGQTTLAPIPSPTQSPSLPSATPGRPRRTPTSIAAIPEAAALAERPSANSWWEVYFTDPVRINNPSQLVESPAARLIAYIDSARSTIDIAAFEFNLDPVVDALIRARKRGVQIRWITDNEHGLDADNEKDRGQFKQLKKAGIEVIPDDRRALMHNKFWIFDREMVWTGSTNVTINDYFRNNNNIIVIRSPELAAIYTQQFDDMWGGRFGSTAPSTVDEQALTIRSTPVQVLFSPEDEALSYLVSLVYSAEKSILFMAFSYTHDELTDAMLERAKKGVTVRGIFETRGSETLYSSLRSLLCAGLPVRQDGNKGTFHHKVMIVDRRIVVTGSMNFSENANDPNNENTVILMNSRIAQQYIKEFERRWAEAPELAKNAIGCK